MEKNNNPKQDLIVIGGGVGGLVTTSVAAQLGLKVTLIEMRDKLGGDCLHMGCVPSKTLIHSAKVATLMRQSKSFGLPEVDFDVDLAQVNQCVQNVIQQIQVHDDPERFRSYGATVIFGKAEFLNAHQVTVNGQVITGKRIIIATGSQPMIPPIPGLDGIEYLTNENIFQQQQLPKRLLVIGGGVIGVELAQAFLRLGSEVTLVELADQLLPNQDPEIAQALQDVLQQEGMAIHTKVIIHKAQQAGDTVTLHCEKDIKFDIQGNALLVATGRRPTVQGLKLEAAGIKYSARGIQVDKRLRTSVKHIYALGDVIDNPLKFTHVAEYQASIVISNAIFRFPKKTDYSVCPAVVFTDPQIAMIGLNEQQAKAKGITPRIIRFDFKDVDRAVTEAETSGFIKLLIHKGKILGASIFGPQAGELVAEIALAMQSKLKIGKISATIHAYPTLAQINRRVVNSYYTDTLFSTKTKRLVKWLQRLI